jgi:hypothetical protein
LVFTVYWGKNLTKDTITTLRLSLHTALEHTTMVGHPVEQQRLMAFLLQTSSQTLLLQPLAIS